MPREVPRRRKRIKLPSILFLLRLKKHQVVEVGDSVGEVLVGKNPDDRLCIHYRLFRGFHVVKYDPWNPDLDCEISSRDLSIWPVGHT